MKVSRVAIIVDSKKQWIKWREEFIDSAMMLDLHRSWQSNDDLGILELGEDDRGNSVIYHRIPHGVVITLNPTRRYDYFIDIRKNPLPDPDGPDQLLSFVLEHLDVEIDPADVAGATVGRLQVSISKLRLPMAEATSAIEKLGKVIAKAFQIPKKMIK